MTRCRVLPLLLAVLFSSVIAAEGTINRINRDTIITDLEPIIDTVPFSIRESEQVESPSTICVKQKHTQLEHFKF